jgi:hypothetical protein
MNTHTDKTQENKSQSVSAAGSQVQSGGESTFQFVDNRPEAIAQRKLQEMANNSPQVSQLRAFQGMANNSPQEKQDAQFTRFSNSPIQRMQIKPPGMLGQPGGILVKNNKAFTSYIRELQRDGYIGQIERHLERILGWKEAVKSKSIIPEAGELESVDWAIGWIRGRLEKSVDEEVAETEGVSVLREKSKEEPKPKKKKRSKRKKKSSISPATIPAEPVAESVPEVHDWGWGVPEPSPAVMQSAFDQVMKRLTESGWKRGEAVLVQKLNARINTIESSINLLTHISIVINDVWNSVKNSIKKDGNSLDETVQNINDVEYHMTIEVGDDLYDKNNPRWFKTGGWSKLPAETSTEEAAKVVDEGQSVMANIR